MCVCARPLARVRVVRGCARARLCAHALEQAPSDAACYAYFEGNGTFAFWGPDSILQLTGLTPMPAT